MDVNDCCKRHHNIIKLAFDELKYCSSISTLYNVTRDSKDSKDNKDNSNKIWNIIISIHTECKDHTSFIIYKLIDAGSYYNDMLVDFYKLSDDVFHYTYCTNIINYAMAYRRNDLFDQFMPYILKLTNYSDGERLRTFILAAKHGNDYVLKRLEILNYLPNDYKVLKEVVDGNLDVLKNSHTWPLLTMNNVFNMAIKIRNRTLANKNFIVGLISRFGICNQAYVFADYFTNLIKIYSKYEDEELISDHVEDMKFYISSGVSVESLMTCASPKLLMKFISFHSNNCTSIGCTRLNNMLKFLIDYGVRDLTKLDLNGDNYHFLISCVFSLGREIFLIPTYEDDGNNGRQELLKGVDSEKLDSACYYLNGANTIINNFVTPVLSSIIIHYLFALNDGVNHKIHYTALC